MDSHGFGELGGKLRITPKDRVALVNAPPESPVVLSVADPCDPEHADVVIGFIVRRTDLAALDSVYAAACDDRPTWIVYPKPGRLGTEVHRDWLARAVRRYGVEPTEHVSIDHTWSALALQMMDDEPDTAAGDIVLAWPDT